MPKGTNQKLKLYRLAQIMLENTDDEHYITMPEIMEELGKYEVTADRKTIYADLRDLSVLGIEVEGEPIGNRYHYRVVNRPFELPELKLLVDSIQSSKFITEKKTNTLIKKLEKLVSKYDAQRLQRQVYVSGRIKTMNESIYYTVDAIHNAISENKKIKFQYFQWNVKKEMELRHGGAWYHISPWGLSWDDENYYMIGYDAEAQLIKHYRVDKMLHIRMSDESREGKEHFKKLDMADYAKKSFGMFRGKETSVKMLVNNSLGTELDSYDMDDSDSVANTDLLSKLSLLMDMGKKKTKYNVLNLNSKFTVDQKQTLEHVFDALYAKYTNAKANDIIQTIIDSF